MSAHTIKTWQERQQEQWPDHPGNTLAPWARLKLADAEISELRARIAELEADRQVLQATGKHPAPCARHCEANAFQIELRQRDARIAELLAALSQAAQPAAGTEQQPIERNIQ